MIQVLDSRGNLKEVILTSATIGSAIQAISAGASNITSGTVIFSNAHGVSFGASNGTITASIAGGGAASISAGTTNVILGQVVFSNSNSVSFGLNGSTLTASFSQTLQSASSLVFSNSNNVSFSTAGGTLVASASFNQSNQSIGLYAVSNSTLGTSGTVDARSLSINGAGNVSVGYSNGSLVISGATAGAGGAAISAGANSQNTGTIIFSNANGISFGLSNDGNMTASYTVPSVTQYQLIANSTLSLGTGVAASFRFTSQNSQLQFTSANTNFVQATALFNGTNASGTIASDGISISVAAPGIASQSNQAVSAGNGSFAFQTISFADSNGVSFSTGTQGLFATVKTDYQSSNAGYLTSQSNQAFSASGGSSAFQTLIFANSNGITFSNSNGSVVASHNGISSQSNQAVSAGNGSSAFQTISFADSNGVSFSTGTQGLFATVKTDYQSSNAAYLTSQSNQAFSASGGSSAFQTLNFANSNGFTFSNSNGSVIASYSVPSTAGLISAINLSAGTTSNNLTAFVLSNSNGLAFGLSGSTITGSYTVPTQSNQNISLYALGNTTQNSSTVLNASQISFNGGGIVTVGFSNGSIQFSASATAAPSPVNFSAGTTSGNLASVVFSNSNGVSFGLNGGTITASAAGGGGIALANSQTTFSSGTIAMSASGALTIGSAAQQFNFSVPQTSSLSATGQVSISVNGATVSIGVPNPSTRSGYSPYGDIPLVEGALGQGVLIFDPEGMPNVQFDRIQFIANISNAVNSSGSQTLSAWFGYYTRNASSLSLLSSVSASYAMTQSGTAGSYSLFGGMRGFTMGMTNTITDGQYWFGFVSRSTSGGANITLNNILISNINSVFSGFFGVASNTSAQRTIGNGIYSATTSGMPSVVAFSEINGQSSIGWRFPIIQLASSTV